MSDCIHKRTITTAAGKFCASCGQAVLYKTAPKSKSAPSADIGVAQIWQR